MKTWQQGALLNNRRVNSRVDGFEAKIVKARNPHYWSILTTLILGIFFSNTSENTFNKVSNFNELYILAG